MANIGPYKNVPYHWQGLSLHCWLNAIEMLMDWKFGSKYGRDPLTDQCRTSHPHAAANARGGMGSNPDFYTEDYGYDRISIGGTLKNFQDALYSRGPILASGAFGPARAGVGGHVILIVGWSKSATLCYYDPFLIGRKAASGNHNQYMTPHAADERVFVRGGMQSYWGARWELDGEPWVNVPKSEIGRRNTNFT